MTNRNGFLYKICSVALCATLLTMSGCAQETVEAPDLKAPVGINESYRPVGYGDIGVIEYCDAVVVPTQYAHFWTTNTAIAEIHVEIGQYVEEGTLLATADVEQVREEIKRVTAEKENYIKMHEFSNSIYEQSLQELEYKKEGLELLKQVAAENETITAIKILKENHRYDELLYEYNLKKYDKTLSEYYELTEDKNLYARASGYVSYIRSLKESNKVKRAENVVIIADYEDAFIELKEETVQNNICKKYTSCYTLMNGMKYELKEYEYPKEQLLAAEGMDLYPRVRLRFADETQKMQVGNSVPVFFARNNVEDVLCVGSDSLYQDSNGYYVYVKTEADKEIRYVEIGLRDSQKVEIVSGLQEGEMVFYSSEAVVPNEYEIYTVETGEFQDIQTTDTISKMMEEPRNIYSDYEGEIVEIVANDMDEVEKGDVVCRIKINEGSAYLADLRNSMTSLTTSYEQGQEALDDLIESLEELQKMPIEQTVEIEDEEGNIHTVTQYIARPYFRGEISCQIATARLNKEKSQISYDYQMSLLQAAYNKASKDNNGSGIISVRAEEAGVIDEISYSVGDKIEVGKVLYKMNVPTSPYVKIVIRDQLAINQTVEFIDEGIDEVYSGRVVGFSGGNLEKQVYITSLDDGIYVSSGDSTGEQTPWVYVIPDNEEYYTNYSLKEDKYVSFSARTISDTFVLPNGVLQSEKLVLEDETLYYVWKEEDEVLIKHYVQFLCSAVDKEGYRYDCVLGGLTEGDELALVRN